jgi:hypothetical protein
MRREKQAPKKKHMALCMHDQSNNYFPCEAIIDQQCFFVATKCIIRVNGESVQHGWNSKRAAKHKLSILYISTSLTVQTKIFLGKDQIKNIVKTNAKK